MIESFDNTSQVADHVTHACCTTSVNHDMKKNGKDFVLPWRSCSPFKIRPKLGIQSGKTRRQARPALWRAGARFRARVPGDIPPLARAAETRGWQQADRRPLGEGGRMAAHEALRSKEHLRLVAPFSAGHFCFCFGARSRTETAVRTSGAPSEG